MPQTKPTTPAEVFQHHLKAALRNIRVLAGGEYNNQFHKATNAINGMNMAYDELAKYIIDYMEGMNNAFDTMEDGYKLKIECLEEQLKEVKSDYLKILLRRTK